MNGEDFLDWLRVILTVMLIVFFVIGAIVGLNNVIRKNREGYCTKLGEQIGYTTRVFSGYCHIEVRPNVWVDKYDIVDFLPLIDCEKDF